MMKIKYFLRGFGTGLIVATVLLFLLYSYQMSDVKVVSRAKELGMVYGKATAEEETSVENYVKEESKRCKELVEFFDSNFNNVKLINENTVVIDDGEKKLVVYLEDYIQHDISNYFAKIGNMF